MGDDDRFSVQFEASRPRLRALAFRMLGSQEEAEDAVQETWLRLERADTDAVDNFGGWLTTVVGRICLDRLRARRARPEDLTGIEPPGLELDAHPGPEDEAVMADSLGSALLLVLDHLSPAERVAFVLHDVFAVPFDEIGSIVGRSPEATRQLASRARRRIQGASTASDVDLVRRRELVSAFLAAARGGDFDALLTILDPGVVLLPDRTAQARGGLREASGVDAVIGFMRGGARAARLALVDGVAGLAWMPGGQMEGAVQFTIRDDRIVEIALIGDPDHLENLDVLVLED
jgi:RNA polymerase sigma-70 factor (ECF subfamily)